MFTALSLLGALLAPAQAADAASLPPEAASHSSVNVLVVRHADKACSPVECDLTEKGYAQREKLRGQVAGLVSDGYELVDVFASNACRTVLTVSAIADDHALAVTAFPAAEGVETCSFPGDGDGLQRPDARERPVKGFAEGDDAPGSRAVVLDTIRAWQPAAGQDGKYLFVIADHSNHVCGWIEGFDVPGEQYEGEGDCVGGNLEETDFADIFWIYDTGSSEARDWHVAILEDAFETDN